MPSYHLTDSQTGDTLTVQGDSPPSQEDAAFLFDVKQKKTAIAKERAAIKPTSTLAQLPAELGAPKTFEEAVATGAAQPQADVGKSILPALNEFSDLVQQMPPASTALGRAAQSAFKAGVGMAAGGTTPEMVPAAVVGGPITKAAFAVMMAKTGIEVPSRIKAIMDRPGPMTDQDKQEITDAFWEGAGSLYLGAKLGVEAGKELRPTKPGFTGPLATGQVLRQPAGAVPLVKAAEAAEPVAPMTAAAVKEQATTGEQNRALQERKSAQVPVEEPPGDRQKVGEGTPAPKETAVPQEQKEMTRERALQVISEHEQRTKDLAQFLRDSESAQRKLIANEGEEEIREPLTEAEQKIVDAVQAHGGELPEDYGPPGNTFEQTQEYKKAVEALRSPEEKRKSAAIESAKAQPEKIVAAAYETPEGKVETGANHPEILNRLGITGLETPESRNTPSFGFVTDMGRFVSREEAGPIAEKSGQALKDFEPNETVHSNEVESPTQPGVALSESAVATSDVLGIKRKNLKPNTLYVGANDWSGSEPIPTTKSVKFKGDPVEALRKFQKSNPDLAPQLIVATDEKGLPSKVISGGGKVADFGTPEADYISGNVNAFRDDALRRIEAAKNKGNFEDANRIANEMADKARAEVEKYRGYISGNQSEIAANKAKEKTGAPVEDTRFPNWRAVNKNIESINQWHLQNIERYENEAKQWESLRVKEGLVGMGGAERSEIPETGAGGEKYGVAERIRAERAQAGQVEEVPPGEGISAPDSVDRGRELLASGTNPEKALSDFEESNKLSSDDMAVVRAHGEELAKKARRIEEEFGTDSGEYTAAFQELSDWDKRSKAMQTEWHKTGMAQQGETDLDTGSFTGLQRAFKDETGKEFTPKQKGEAEKVAKGVKEKETAKTEAENKLLDELKLERTPAEQKAMEAVWKVHRDAAARLAEAEAKRRVADTVRKQKVADIQVKAAKKALEAANKRRIKAASDLAAAERKRQANPDQHVWERVRVYIDKGIDNFDTIRHKVATDLGMSVDKVTRLLAYDKRVKALADDVWRKQQAERRVKEEAKRWLANLEVPGYKRLLASIPQTLFSWKVGIHGFVGLGTHAPMVAFDPRYAATYIKNYGKIFGLVFRPEFYERKVQDLIRDPNYPVANRAGLQNDPFVYEEYHTSFINNLVKSWMGGKSADTLKTITSSGNRGYSILKMLRQDMFSQQWSKLPKTMQIPEVAKAIADDVNHYTGVVKGMAPKGSNLLLFAPRLGASRVMWLYGDPARMVDTFANWKNANPGDKYFATQQLKSKAIVFGTFASLLALNQGLLTASGSKQKINGIPKAMGGAGFDPMESDFMKFKAAGLDLAYGSAMMNMGKLPVRLATAIMFSGKTSKLILEDERVYKIAGDYLRSQMSPFAGTVTDLGLGRDFAGRPLPRKGFGLLPGDTDLPKRLRAHGITEPYSWTEYSSIQFPPIPISEGIREVWGKGGLGMTEDQQKRLLKAWAITSLMSLTGARVTDDNRTEETP